MAFSEYMNFNNHRLLSLAGIENDTYPISTNVTNLTRVAKVRLEMQMHVQNEKSVIIFTLWS